MAVLMSCESVSDISPNIFQATRFNEVTSDVEVHYIIARKVLYSVRAVPPIHRYGSPHKNCSVCLVTTVITRGARHHLILRYGRLSKLLTDGEDLRRVVGVDMAAATSPS